MFCKYCGKEISNNSRFCAYCGASFDEPSFNNTNYTNTNNDDTGSIGWGILGYFVPLAGLILFIVWYSEKPKNAKSAGIGALISVIMNIVFSIFIVIAFINGLFFY